jgi:hypothetical protein
MKETGRHELACSRCGAPLHELKMLPVRKTAAPKPDRELVRPSAVRTQRPKALVKKQKKKKPRKSLRPFKFLKDAFEDAFEFVEDIFD